jgi:hypothetical protein
MLSVPMLNLAGSEAVVVFFRSVSLAVNVIQRPTRHKQVQFGSG